MTHTLIKRGQARGQGGFAIGLILLVVLLIAVIIAAIALATRNSSNKGNEKDRVAASNLIQQAVTFDQASQRTSSSTGLLTWELTTARTTAATVTVGPVIYNAPNNIFGANGGFPGQPDVDKDVFEKKCEGIAYVNVATTAALAAADSALNGCQWHITTVWGSRVAAAGAGDFTVQSAKESSVAVLYTFPLRGSIASQLNNVLWQSEIGTQLFVAGIATTEQLGKNVIVSGTPTDTEPSIAAGLPLTTPQADGAVTGATAVGTFHKAFGAATSVYVGNAKNILVATSAIDSTNTTNTRFPYIAGGERVEGVVQIGGGQQNDAEEKVPAAGTTGVRAYYRALNTPLVD